MPRPLLQAVAALLALGAAGSFAMGVINAPERGRMPGQRAGETSAFGATAINAADATPITQDRIEAPPKPVEKAASNTDDSDDSDDSADSAANATPAVKTADATKPAAGATNTLPTAPADTSAPATPSPDEPPH
ncbi:MAG: hypothetical protein E7812_18165 [Phenylobacterium sp.]|nr:MAG: hypothetical protein E7812_18165 [Phenylobacterium sp.]